MVDPYPNSTQTGKVGLTAATINKSIPTLRDQFAVLAIAAKVQRV
jgi:hypothetical protein